MSTRLQKQDHLLISPLADHIDFGHLERYTMGEPALTRELLEAFCRELSSFHPDEETPAPEQRRVVHRLKGAARAIGAFPLAESAEWLEKLLEAEADAPDLAAAREELRQQVAALRRACKRWRELERG